MTITPFEADSEPEPVTQRTRDHLANVERREAERSTQRQSRPLYLDPAAMDELRGRSDELVIEMNGEWATYNLDHAGEVKPGLKDIIGGPQLIRHMVKWSVKSGRLKAHPELSLDPDGKVIGCATLGDAFRYCGIVVAHSDQRGIDEFWDEARQYCRNLMVERLAADRQKEADQQSRQRALDPATDDIDV